MCCRISFSTTNWREKMKFSKKKAEIAELRFDIENRDREIERLERKVALLQSNKRENEKRLAKIRQAAFGIVDWGIED